MQEVPLSDCPPPPTLPQQSEAMSNMSGLFLALMILQLLLYSYFLVLELPSYDLITLCSSSVADPPDCTSAASTPSEAEASEAFAPADEVEDELIERGHAFLDHLAQLNVSSEACPS